MISRLQVAAGRGSESEVVPSKSEGGPWGGGVARGAPWEEARRQLGKGVQGTVSGKLGPGEGE